ncbi:iron complex outermembrane receptor protein [Povalibacter uvarum]|uniref:Iron complex outermembrane receptor protein n=1 Tax=Povalibacter uvarum TaxID=732238 RepID=A0A841HP14_9GAMM|nr:TonB-dependent receptor [Povalibacter uvarum]MBB6094877.1 iron complex outermembrane receptor protein [Povalibacter uvarum]
MQPDRSASRLLSAASLTLLASYSAHAQTVPSEEKNVLEQIVVTGTRVENRSALDTAVPVDVISAETLANSGTTEVNQALSTVLPSFNFPRPGLADGTDTIRPATLRGLAPDQTLVLVNSKRRHSASLVNVNGTIGRGSSAVDMNTIPSAMVKSIEVLRDGASAQYGSDAIAGVINLQLRDNSDGGGASGSYGWRESSYKTPTTQPPANATWTVPSPDVDRDVSDGETLVVSAWKGLSLGQDGFLTIAAEYKDQQRTERDGLDFRQQYPLVGGTYDAREQTIERFNAWSGEPDMEQKTIFLNTGYDLSGGVQLYGWASYQERDVESAGFFRRALDDRNVIQIYADGFLPIIAPEVTDYSAAAGVKWGWGDWDMDSSLVYGKNEMDFTIKNTLNRSLGTASPTVFDAGGFDYDQIVFNFSGVRGIDVGLASPLNLAIGLEAREEGYSITAGEPDSYRNGGVLLPLSVPGTGCATPTAAQIAAGGCATASGSQVFPGFRPENEVDEDRTAVGVYIDLEANLTEKLLASVAVRGEDYSDFGENFSGKFALRYDFTDAFALRASIQNGFRAPSLQQQFFATTSTNFIGGVPFDVTTFPVSDPIAVALGAKPLDAEESLNYSVGAVMRFGELSLTVDAYWINIDDRIVLSENLTQANVRSYLETQGFIGSGGGRFFINGVDTETSGVDIVAHYPLQTDGAGRFDLTLTANYNSTDVTRIPEIDAPITPAPPLFDRFNVLTMEKGNPEDKYTFNVNWDLQRWGATVRAIRYGKVFVPDSGTNATFANVNAGTYVPIDQWLAAETIVDLEGRFSFTDNIRLAIGAENVFDEYPDPVPIALNSTGNLPYSNYGPFGRAGRFVYGRLMVDF